jgi:TrmH family RNA methyltransferase
MSPLITSLQNERVKTAVKLRDRRGRDRQKRMLIDGQREIGLALAADVLIECLFICDELCDDASAKLIWQAKATGAELLQVSRPVMEKLAFGDRAEGLLAVAQPPRRSLGDVAVQLKLAPPEVDEFAPPSNISFDAIAAQPLIAILESVEKPGNLGAVLRTADAAGVSAVLVADGATDLFNPNAVRASLGAIFTVPLAAAEATTILAWLRTYQFQVLATRVDGSIDYTTAAYHGRRAIVLGSESRGLSDAWRGDDIQAIRLPMQGQVDSLNVSATAAVLFYEALRQRSGQST